MRLAVRTASGVALFGLFLAALWLGDLFVDAFVALVVGLALREYWKLWRGAGIQVDLVVLFGLAAVWLFRYSYGQLPEAGTILAVAVLAGLAISLRFAPESKPFLRWALALGGAAWLGFCPGFLLLLYHGIANR
ncbi:MAG: phosphatidate cytidylyltransferase, partial [Candidatus Dormiibacterota bacterium]